MVSRCVIWYGMHREKAQKPTESVKPDTDMHMFVEDSSFKAKDEMTFMHTDVLENIGLHMGKYRASTITGLTVYFTKRTGHLKMRYSQFFSLSEHNKHTKLHSQYRKN